MPKVFVLGDSRTGTTSVHRFLQSAGFQSIHYYFKESGVSQNNEVAQPVNRETSENWKLMRKFIDTSGYDAFSDYPTRTFYEELIDHYSDAYFILTVRKDLNTWQRSMTQFMGKFGFDLDIPSLSKAHISINDKIRKLAAQSGIRFCEVNIDASSNENSRQLSEFLDLDDIVQLGRENATESYDLRLWSSRLTLFDLPEGDIVSYVEKSCAPSKAMLSEYGWVFLTNDSSDFLQFLYGNKVWSESDANNAVSTLRTRREVLGKRNIIYQKYVVPEKTVVYPQYMPKIFSKLTLSDKRPAQFVAEQNIDGYSYLADVLKDASSHGFTYFKGDSHANWLGAHFIYTHIVESLNESLPAPKRRVATPLSKLTPSLAGYAGDIATQLSDEHKRVMSGTLSPFSFKNIFEYTVKYEIPDNKRNARPAPIAREYLAVLGDRPTFAFENKNKALPRAVIFRDSTSDWLVELLAEHFSRSVFIWHKGQVYEDIIEREKPDVVLHIMAERFFMQYRQFKPFATILDGKPKSPSEAVEKETGSSAKPEQSGKRSVKGWRRLWKRFNS